MLKNSDESIFDILHAMYNTWLEQGDLPTETKIDYKKFHRKPNKPTYNKGKSYRPISLESLILKSFMRILRERVDWKIETNMGLSTTQEAYRKDRSANDIMLRFVQFVQEAWNRGETVVLAVIDYDSFFENIWRDLLLVKMHKLGIRGKILKTLHNYLCERKYCFEVNEFVSEFKESGIGVPQGGIPSTTMANVYTHDSDTTSLDGHAEFSDDNLKFEAHLDEIMAIQNLQRRLDAFSEWCKKNNIKISPEKVKIMIFRPKNSPRPYNLPRIFIDGKLIEVVEEKRVLGTVLDCNLNFDAHFQSVEKACFSAFNNVKHLYTGKNTPCIKTGGILYKTLIRTIMDYSTAAIANISDQQMKKMQSIQHKCLRMVTQSLASTSREVLNLITNIVPIDLHFKLRCSESLARIKSKNSPICWSYQKWHGNNSGIVKDKITTYNKNIKFYEVTDVKPYHSKIPPFIERSVLIQSEASKEQQKVKLDLVRAENNYDYVISTDGSTLKTKNDSLGPSASAAVIFKDGRSQAVASLSQSLGRFSNNYEAELIALQLGLSYLHTEEVRDSKILFASDCVPALEMTFSNKIAVDYNHAILTNKDILEKLEIDYNNDIEAIWVPGHEGVHINELADETAKLEAAKKVNIQRPWERKIALTVLRQEVLKNWQTRVCMELSDHRITEVNSTVNSWSTFNWKGQKHMLRLLTGHHFLNSFQSKLNPTSISENCVCGQKETVHHFLFTCQRYIRYRQKWFYKIYDITGELDALNQVSNKTAFGQREDLTLSENSKLQEAICQYLLETKRFVC